METDPLVGMLQRLSLHELLLICQQVLARAGFGDVEVLDRRRSREKSRFGGHEIQCRGRYAGIDVLVAVKLICGRLNTRMFDEMCGVVDRRRADMGLLISPYHLSAAGAQKQARYARAHLEVLDGPKLAQMMRCSGIGVRPKGDVDYAFFDELRVQSGRILNFLETGEFV